MPMGIVSNDDFDSELNNLIPKKESNEKNESSESVEDKFKRLGILTPGRGRGDGNVEVPDALRRLIGIESLTDGRSSALSLANDFGISSSSVSAYSNGATSTSSYSDKPNGKTIRDAKERISKKARGKLLLALNHITDDKLACGKLTDVSAVARDMSAIIKNMDESTKGEVNGGTTMNSPQFVFYSPTITKESEYEVITVKE